MSAPPYPSKFFVPALPREYVNFGQCDNTAEAELLRLLDPSTRAPSIVVQGPGGTGKTTSLLGVGHHPDVWTRFSDAVWFVSLGQDSNPSALLEDLETVVRAVVGESHSDEIDRLSKSRNRASAATEAIQFLNDRAVLLLIDDVWADGQARSIRQCTVFSLVQECLLKVERNPGRLCVVVSTRDADVARLVPRQCRVTSEPFGARDHSAKEILCKYSEVPFEDIEKARPVVETSFYDVLDRCGGLQLALAIAGRSVCDQMEFGVLGREAVWSAYAKELGTVEAFLKETQPDHPGIHAMLELGLQHLKARLEKVDFRLPGELKMLFSCLGVVKKQEKVPLSVVACIWGMSEDDTRRLCVAMVKLHLVSMKEEDGMPRVTIHDLIHDFCDVALSEKPEMKTYAHRMTVQGVELLLPGGSASIQRIGCAPVWKLCDAKLDAEGRDYFVRNIARHMTEAGREYTERLFCLITDFRWFEARVQLSKNGNDLSGILDDVEMLLSRCGEEIDEDVKRSIEVLSDATRLSMWYVLKNPRELAYQLDGRLNRHAGLNQVVDRFLSSLEMHARRPWLKSGRAVLQAAGESTVLSVTLPKRLCCIALMPNGEDVVVGGGDGYLSVFSIRYATEVYELPGQYGDVDCVAVYAATKRVFTGGSHKTVTSWQLGNSELTGDVLVKHDRPIHSLAVTADGSRIVFGDSDGRIVVCDSISGTVLRSWVGHKDTVRSLVIRERDGMIVSGSRDCTIARWDSTSGLQSGERIVFEGENVNSVALSRDGNRIASASGNQIRVIDMESAKKKVLRQHGKVSLPTRAIFGLDDKTVLIGTWNCQTATLDGDGNIIWKTGPPALRILFSNRDKSISGDYSGMGISGMAQTRSGLLVCVSRNCTLSVQNLDRFPNFQARHPRRMGRLRAFVVLPDRKRILFDKWGPQNSEVQLLNTSTAFAEMELSARSLVNSSANVIKSQGGISALAVSRDGRWAVAGTLSGRVLVLDTDTWNQEHPWMHHFCSAVVTVAISNDAKFLAAGTDKGDLGLFRRESGSEVQLRDEEGKKFGRFSDMLLVAFNEESSMLFAVDSSSSALHIWKHLDEPTDIVYVTVGIGIEGRSVSRTLSMIATCSHVAVRGLEDENTVVIDFLQGSSSSYTTEEEDESGILQISHQEHRAFARKGALFMMPFNKAIRYCDGSDSEVLGTLEEQVCHSFRPDHWTFDKDTGIFVAGGLDSSIVSARLMKESGILRDGGSEAPQLPHLWKTPAVTAGINPGVGDVHNRDFKVFISHAGPDKKDVAIPLHDRLQARGIRSFVDSVDLRVGEHAPKEMQAAMDVASVGVFIMSPEFAGRRWTLKELVCFLDRARHVNGSDETDPGIIAVFYRLGLRECQDVNLYSNKSRAGPVIFEQSFFDKRRQLEMPTEKAEEAMREVTQYTGILTSEGRSDGEGQWEIQMNRDKLLDSIASSVEEALRIHDAKIGPPDSA